MLIRVSTAFNLPARLSWFVVVLAIVVATFLAGYLMTALLQRSPLAPLLVGPRATQWPRERNSPP
jgi:hypothetical protein